MASGPYYKVKVLALYIILYLKGNFGYIPSFKKEKHVSILVGNDSLPFFLKDKLDFDVLLDSVYDDQYSLIDIEGNVNKNNIKVVFDLGANIGTATLKFYQKFPNATIYCFEPDPYNFERLSKNISLLDKKDRIKLYNYAVSDSDNGKVSFYRAKSNHWSSSLKKRDCTEEEVLVETITLDTFCINNTINKIDVVKMDIEGAESEAMKGFVNSVFHTDYIIGELHPKLMKDTTLEFLARFNSFDLEYLNTSSGIFKFRNSKINQYL
ncbi:MAG: FkbM family methyltransferase [Melioribacteraceae bacterium]|nr:FkbM family methyltransferase [Melioribacteraceae bacterium]